MSYIETSSVLALRILAAILILSHYQVSVPVHAASSLLSTSETLVFGPGLYEDTTALPINYFYIQARDREGKK